MEERDFCFWFGGVFSPPAPGLLYFGIGWLVGIGIGDWDSTALAVFASPLFTFSLFFFYFRSFC